MSRTEIRLSGSGGQGLILAGIILAEAAILDGKNAVQTQSYGPEARGGASRAEVIISNDEIDYPKVISPDLLLALTNQACQKFLPSLKTDGILIIDSSIPTPVTSARVYSLPIIETAEKKVGRQGVANIVALGVITALTEIASPESIEQAVLQRVPQGTEALNRQALACGKQLVSR
ncbi:MAG: 2-oxoacid:ferredoxin oxidoreductase subunit gamma [Firmicutes bacterium]|nr:2-oxoacid:ferredoxin oxidoreductase subunit gamma [Bacillota bacterium]